LTSTDPHDQRLTPAIGIDIGGTKILAVRLNEAGEVASWKKVSTPAGSAGIVEAVIGVAGELAGGDELSIGVGCPGMVDRRGKVNFAPNLHGMDGVDMAAELGARWRGPVSVTNDATCAAWSEFRLGAAQGYDTVVMVTLGTGIGGGIIANGHLITGAHGFAGEIGHAVIDPHGPPCPCGQRGCWERFASGSGLGRIAREAAIADKAPGLVELAGGDPEAVRGEHVTQAAAAGDPGAIEVMANFAWWLALGLANLSNTFDPDAIVLGGGLIEAGEVLMGPARRAFAELVEGNEYRQVAILPATLGERAGAIGAALIGSGR
jgi:glucokinase